MKDSRTVSAWKRGALALSAALVAVPLLTVGAASANPEAVESSSAPTVRDGWLLPWPTADDTAAVAQEAGVAGRADAAPASEEAASRDEALTAFRRAEAARAAWRAAERLLPVAEQKARNAAATATVLTKVAEEKKAAAEEEADRVAETTRHAYITGSTPQIGALLNTGDAADVTDALTATDRFANALSFQIGEAKEAEQEAVEASSAATAAVAASQAAQGEVLRLRRVVLEQKAVEREALKTFKSFMADTGSQVDIDVNGCPKEDVPGTLRNGAEAVGAAKLCRDSVRQAATPQAALAIKYAFSKLGAPYACDGVGRMGEWRFDCSSLVSRAYAETVGIPFPADTAWAHSTRDMMPWDGVPLDPHYVGVEVKNIRPGDLLLYRSCSSPSCAYQHVTMALADGYMLHTNSCGDVAHITKAPGYGPGSSFVVARRVTFLPGEEALVKAMKNNPWVPPAMSGKNLTDDMIFVPGDDVDVRFTSGPGITPEPRPTAAPQPRPSATPTPTRNPSPRPTPTATPTPTPSFSLEPTPSPSSTADTP